MQNHDRNEQKTFANQHRIYSQTNLCALGVLCGRFLLRRKDKIIKKTFERYKIMIEMNKKHLQINTQSIAKLTSVPLVFFVVKKPLTNARIQVKTLSYQH